MFARTRTVIVAAAAAVAVLSGGAAWLASRNAPWAHFLGTAPQPTFVGSEACAQCHPAEAKF
jgi:hypothetical protein